MTRERTLSHLDNNRWIEAVRQMACHHFRVEGSKLRRCVSDSYRL